MSINLLPWREKEKQRQQYLIWGILAVSILTVVVGLFIWHINLEQFLRQQKNKSHQIQTQTGVLTQKYRAIMGIHKTSDKLLDQIQTVEQIQYQQQLTLFALRELVAKIPSNIYLLSVNKQEQAVIINGIAATHANIEVFVNNISKAKWLKAPILQETESSANINFILECELKS